MKSLLKLASVRAARVDSSATVMEAIDAMSKAAVGAVLVLEGDVLKGVFTERDVMLRVVRENRDAETTPVKDVMTSPVASVRKDEANPDDILQTMLEGHFRHLPIIGEDGKVEGVISIRHLLQRKVEDLTREVDSLEAYMTADGIGG